MKEIYTAIRRRRPMTAASNQTAGVPVALPSVSHTVVHKDRPQYKFECEVSETAKGFPQVTVVARDDGPTLLDVVKTSLEAYHAAVALARPVDSAHSATTSSS